MATKVTADTTFIKASDINALKTEIDAELMRRGGEGSV